MGEPRPAPLPPGAPILLVLLSLAGSGEPGDAEKSHFWQNLLPKEQHRCRGVLRLILQQHGDSSWGLRFGDSSLCQSVAFFDHPCAPPFLRRQLALLARACLPHRILASPSGLALERPLALVVRGAGLHMAKMDLAQAVAWLNSHAARQNSQRGGSYWRLLKRAPVASREALQKLFQRSEGHGNPWKLQIPGRKRRALGRAKQLRYPHAAMDHGSNSAVASQDQSRTSIRTPFTSSLRPERKGIPKPASLSGGAELSMTPPSEQDTHLSPPTEGRATGSAVCRCPGRELGKVQDQQGKKEVKGQQVGVRIPTPRTEEAAWAASTLTFLLVVLMLAVLYTRLHQKCRRGRSLYWSTSGEEGNDTVAAVIKHRLLSVQGRRKKRSRHQRSAQRAALLTATSSDSSD
ncbi:tumor protein p53-inducible protein 13 [Rhineura floridana]|uniref:tumor protein p53-inducible protein 13 n=1 Tax=Rhineura floridana TaxID=261503 RepID=UPI002AC8754E|nr:tumor protein p53-inducible protein 13 [Rhineura floridana]